MEAVSTPVVPEQRQPLAAPSAYEHGTCGSPEVHAARKTLQGMAAICGAGKIVILLGGRFDPAEEHACASCASATAAH